MAQNGEILNYLLAWDISLKTGIGIEDILSQAESFFAKERKDVKEVKKLNDDVEEVYKAYPPVDMNNTASGKPRSTHKGAKDKEKIERLLKTHTKAELLAVIRQTVDDGSWLKDFGTFLNNLPDLREELTFGVRKQVRH